VEGDVEVVEGIDEAFVESCNTELHEEMTVLGISTAFFVLVVCKISGTLPESSNGGECTGCLSRPNTTLSGCGMLCCVGGG